MATGKFANSVQTIFGAFILICFVCLISFGSCEDENNSWKKKDVRDYNDADLERLYEQWEEDDEPLEDDELPEWKRPQPKIDLSNLDPNDPEKMLSATKKGRTLMIFATISGNPSESESEEISKIWQSSLFNAHFELQRYTVASNRVLFVLNDGAKAWEVKDYLVNQERCELVTIEGKDYYGKGSSHKQEPISNDTKPKKTAKKSTNKKKSANDIKKEEL